MRMFDQFDFVPQSDTMSLEAENMENKTIPSLTIYKVNAWVSAFLVLKARFFQTKELVPDTKMPANKGSRVWPIFCSVRSKW